ncbi:MAG: FkbM family methyltransferase, partial [Blastocatellia bacterium]
MRSQTPDALALTHEEVRPSILRRMISLSQRPWREKRRSIGFRWLRYVPGIPFPLRLPFGVWWLAENDDYGYNLLSGDYETREWRFVARFLRPGMNVLDIGAHHGFYTMLASRCVGPQGRVIAFEPSPRERSKLTRHVRLNHCRNVEIEAFAVGDTDSQAELFLVKGVETGCNSLRLPNVSAPTQRILVSVRTLDSVLPCRGISHVDFAKIDVEGAEWSVFKGAAALLSRRPRPVILCELEDIRTAPWGYRAQEAAEFLRQAGFYWFQISPEGYLQPLQSFGDSACRNCVAVPEERLR